MLRALIGVIAVLMALAAVPAMADGPRGQLAAIDSQQAVS